jgi:hypothetical protein
MAAQRTQGVLITMDLTKLIRTAAGLAVCLAVAGLGLMARQALGQETNQWPAEAFDKLHRLMAPGPNDSQWMQVPWMPSSNIYAARKKAAVEGKPLLLWYMAGEPLGTC